MQMLVIKKRNHLSSGTNRGLLWRIRDLCTVLLISQFIFSCVGGDERRIGGSSGISDAPFVVGEITKQNNFDPIILNEEDGLLSHFTLNLKACITDRLRADLSIQSTEFIIQYKTNFGTEDGKLTTKKERVSSDRNGCIQWEETYKYRFVRNSVWIGLKRDIIVEDNAYTGKREIPIAVNPWLNSDSKIKFPSILDTRDHYNKNSSTLKNRLKPDGLSFLSKKSDPLQLWAPVIDMQAEINPSNKKPFSSPDCPVEEITDKMRNSLSDEKIKLIEENNTECFRKLLEPYQTECTSIDHEGCYRRYVTLDAIIPLKLKRLGVDGNFIEEDLTGGEYDVELQVVIEPSGTGESKEDEEDKEDKKDYYRLHDKICKKDNLKLRSDVGDQNIPHLNLSCPIKISHFSNSGTYKLLLSIKPSIKSNLSFKKFEGVHNFEFDFTGKRNIYPIDNAMDPEYTDLREGEEIDYISTLKVQSIYDLLQKGQMEFSKPRANIKSTEDSYITRRVDDIEEFVSEESQNWLSLVKDEEGSAYISPLDKFYLPGADIEKVAFKFGFVKNSGECKTNETPVEREVLFIGEVCLNDTLSQGVDKRFSNIPVRIFIQRKHNGQLIYEYFKKNKDKDKYPTINASGCAGIEIPVRHKIYDRQRMYLYDIHIVSEDENIYSKANVAFSPWQRAFQAFQDVTKSEEEKLRTDPKGIPKPRMVIPNFRSVNFFHSFALNRLLNIHLFHRIYFLFQPFIIRHDDLSFGLNRKALGGLRDGYYLVRLLLLRNPQETLNSEIERVKIIEFNDSTNQVNFQENTDLEDNECPSDVEVDARYGRCLKASENPKYDLSTMEYITHTDMIVRAEANLVNLYAPFHISHRQLYYTGSRNLISIEVVPANPEGFVFKDIEDGGECELNQEETKWWPYSLNKDGTRKNEEDDHELVNYPFVGPFTISNWSNWNILRPAKGFDSDKFIDRFEEGRNNRKFFLHPKNEGEVQGIEQDQDQEQIQEQIQGQGQGQGQRQGQGQDQAMAQGTSSSSASPSEEMESLEEDSSFHQTITSNCSNSGHIDPNSDNSGFEESTIGNCTKDFLDGKTPDQIAKQALKRDDEGDSHPFSDPADILPKFAEANSLKLVELSSPTGEQFIEDIVKAGHLEFENREEWSYLSKDEIIPLLSSAERHKLSAEIEIRCDVHSIQNQIIEGDFSLLLGYVEKLSLKENVRNHLIENLNKGEPKVLFDYVKGLSFREEALDHFISLFGINFTSDKIKNLSSLLSSVCEHDVLSDYIKELEKEMVFLKNIDAPVSDNTAENIRKNLGKSKQILGDIKNTESFQNARIDYLSIDRKKINDITSSKLRMDDMDFMPFARSLCRFWFDDYLTKYLEKEQMISAYTNFIRKFDYYQVLDRNYHMEDKFNIFNILMGEIGLDREEDHISPHYDAIHSVYEKSSIPLCHTEYESCIISDYCLSEKADSNICESQNKEDNSCREVLKAECDRNKNFPLCKKTDGGNCTQDMRNFCLINSDLSICSQFASRCLQNYHSCIKMEGTSDLFDLRQMPIERECLLSTNEKKELDVWETDKNGNNLYEKCDDLVLHNPLRSCLEDPSSFFKFERKMAVHKLSKETPTYMGGLTRNITITGGFAIGSYMTWNSDRGRGITSHLRLSHFITGIPIIGSVIKPVIQFISPLMEFSQRMSASEGNSARRATDTGIREQMGSIFVSQVDIEIGVKKFQKCLVVKPRPNAFFESHSSAAVFDNGLKDYHENLWTDTFKGKTYKQIAVSRPGLMLCGPVISIEDDKPSEKIIETYYYISQDQSESSGMQLLNPYDLANRPFVNVLRGKREFLKFHRMMQTAIEGEDRSEIQTAPTNVFINYPEPIEEARLLSLNWREFNETSFYEGIYDDSDMVDHSDLSFRDPRDTWFKEIFDRSDQIIFYDVPGISSNTRIPVDNKR